LTNVYVKNDGGNGPLIIGIVIVIVVLILLWWFLFSGGGATPAPTGGPSLPEVTNPLPQGS
jgi:hypothetical protein